MSEPQTWIPLESSNSESPKKSPSRWEAIAQDTLAIISDIHALLMEELQLPDPFQSDDPTIGEAYMMLTPGDLPAPNPGYLQPVQATFLASSAFGDYLEAREWSLRMGILLNGLLPTIKSKIDRRNLLVEVKRTSNITTGQPRSPLKANGVERSHIWIVDVLCPITIELMLPTDIISGYW